MNSKVTANKVQFTNEHQALIEGCKKGDQKAQFQIYRLYYKAMFNTSLRIVNDTMEAEDIMQEAFLTAFEKISTYSGTVSFGAWLKRIVQNRSIDALNKKRRVVFEELEAIQEVPEENLVDNSNSEQTEEKVGILMEAVKRLPHRYRNIISLHLFEGYDHEEISEILSITTSTSRSQYSRARQKILCDIGNI